MKHAGVFESDLRHQLVQLFVELFPFFVPLLLVVSLDQPLNPAVGSLSRIVEVSEGNCLLVA
jgi:hypothetical protein